MLPKATSDLKDAELTKLVRIHPEPRRKNSCPREAPLAEGCFVVALVDWGQRHADSRDTVNN